MTEALRIPEWRRAQCAYCKDVLDMEAFGVCRYVEGWVMRRRGGGGHGVSIPKQHNRWAHGRCVERAAAGLEQQGSLL